MKTKFFGTAIAVAFFAFSVASCSQPSSNNSAKDNNAEATTTETTAKTETKTPKTGTQTITGEVLDMSCYMDHGAMGQSHKKCAEGCLKKGLPAGILGSNGQVYILLEDHDASDAYKAALKHAAENVSITGNVVIKNGVQSLIVEKVDASATTES